MDINQLIAHNGACFYSIVFSVDLSGRRDRRHLRRVAAAQGLVDPLLLLGAAWLGSFAGDQFYFWIARHFGVRLLERFPRWRHGVDGALRWLERYDACSFCRSASSMACATSRRSHWV